MYKIKKKKPYISIILPTFNCAYTIRSIKSVLNQSYRNWELNIIDNNKNKKEKINIMKFNDKRIRYFKINNKGIIAKSRNLGIKKSKFNWVAFLDSDDYWSKDKLKIVVDNINKYNYDLYYHDMLIHEYDKNRKNIKLYDGKLEITNPIQDHLILEGNKIPQSSVVVKKKIIEKIGYLSERKELIAWEDFDLWIKISKITSKFFYINKDLGFYWVNDKKFNKLQNYIKIIKKFEIIYKKDIDALKKKYKLKNIDWINLAKSKSYLKSKNYYLGLKHFQKVRNKPLKDKLAFSLINIMNKLKII